MERRILLLILISFILYGCSFVDASPPIVHITYPGNNATVTGIITIRGTASDNVAIAYVEIKTGNSVWTRVNGTESWSYALDTNRISTTQVAISVRAIDTFQCVSPL